VPLGFFLCSMSTCLPVAVGLSGYHILSTAKTWTRMVLGLLLLLLGAYGLRRVSHHCDKLDKLQRWQEFKQGVPVPYPQMPPRYFR